MIEPDSGSIIFDQQSIINYVPSELRRDMVLVPQESVMFPGTVEENIGFSLKVNNLFNEEIVKKSLSDTGLPKEFLSKNAGQLSGGEKKRVSLARALALSPKMLLLDEPTTGIDPKNLDTVEKRILDFSKQRNLTVLWVTHDVEQAKRVSNRIANIKDGKVTTINTPDKFQWGEAY